MKTKIYLLLTLLLFSLMSCTLPAYRLSFEIDGWAPSNSGVNVDYPLENVGRTSLDNVRIQISVYDGSSDLLNEAWTTYENLSVGERNSVTNFYIELFGGSAAYVQITAAGWDDND
ncbi:MAG: hypothetical protein PF447_08580 [Spirochaetaceae bacterium]|jgi:hypothetical protein|nr:hypothetical protein [Spirochaetaceae bacterium]